MGQQNADTIEFRPWQQITDALNSNQHVLADICLLRVGDTVDILEVESLNTEQILSTIVSDITVLSINPGTKKVTFSVAFDTSALVGLPFVKIDNIDDSQQAIERSLCDPQNNPGSFDLRETITDFEADAPGVGKGLYDIADATLWRVGDEVKVVDDNGVLIASTTVFAVNVNADDTNNKATIAVNDNTAVPLGNNPYIQNLTITGEIAIKRNQEHLDEIDRPRRNKLPLQQPNGAHGCFEYPENFLNGSAECHVDGNKKFPGEVGTRAELVQGALPDGQLTFTAMILNAFGNSTKIEVVNAAGLTITVTGNHKVGFTVQINNNSGAATAQQIADALNADAVVKRIVQVVYSGSGATAVIAFGPSSLAGGLNDATRDYAEIEQVFENKISGTGFKFISFNIRPDLPNRMNKVPKDSEEMDIAYVRIRDNQDR